MQQSYSTADMTRRYEARKEANVGILIRLKRGFDPVGGKRKGIEDVFVLKGLIRDAYDEIKMLRVEKTALLAHLEGGVRFVELAAAGKKAPRKAVNDYLKVVETLITRVSGG